MACAHRPVSMWSTIPNPVVQGYLSFPADLRASYHSTSRAVTHGAGRPLGHKNEAAVAPSRSVLRSGIGASYLRLGNTSPEVHRAHGAGTDFRRKNPNQRRPAAAREALESEDYEAPTAGALAARDDLMDPQYTADEEEHERWAARMWFRIDRDGSGSVTREELACEEFRSAVRSLIAPAQVHSTAVTYSRAKMNIEQCISFCMRKADLNDDNKLSYEEFQSMTWYLRQAHLAKHTAYLVFSLFDLNGNGVIEEDEFREIYRFYLGRSPQERAFQEEWLHLAGGEETADRDAYIRWLRASENPIFKPHAPPIEKVHGSTGEDRAPLLSASQRAGGRAAGFGLPPSHRIKHVKDVNERPDWNDHFAAGANPNQELQHHQRHYFRKSQSLPALRKHYEKHNQNGGFDDHMKAMSAPQARVKKPPRAMLSTDNGLAMELIPHKYVPTGSQRCKHTGKGTQWMENFQNPDFPESLARKCVTGTHDFRCAEPAPHLLRRFSQDDY